MCVSDPSDEDVLCTACRIKCHVKLKKHIEKKDTAPKDTLFHHNKEALPDTPGVHPLSPFRYLRPPPAMPVVSFANDPDPN